MNKVHGYAFTIPFIYMNIYSHFAVIML